VPGAPPEGAPSAWSRDPSSSWPRPHPTYIRPRIWCSQVPHRARNRHRHRARCHRPIDLLRMSAAMRAQSCASPRRPNKRKASRQALRLFTMTGWGVCMAALFTLQQQRAIAVNPERSNLILALNNSALYLGASIGAAAGGLVISSVSLAFLAPTSAAVAVLGLIALLLLPRGGAPATPGPPNASLLV
jgi:hypothetical protein